MGTIGRHVPFYIRRIGENVLMRRQCSHHMQCYLFSDELDELQKDELDELQKVKKRDCKKSKKGIAESQEKGKNEA